MSEKYWNGLVYDLAHPRIQVNADKAGCEVFIVSGKMGTLRVLALSSQDADDGYYRVLQEHDDYCPDCGGFVNCYCGDDEDDD